MQKDLAANSVLPHTLAMEIPLGSFVTLRSGLVLCVTAADPDGGWWGADDDGGDHWFDANQILSK